MSDTKQSSWRDYLPAVIQWGGWGVAMVTWVVATITYMSSPNDVQPPPPPPPFPADGQPAVIDEGQAAEFVPATGWVPDPDAVRRVVQAEGIPEFKDTPAGKAVQGDEDVFLWRQVPTVGGRYPAVNQRDVGCCVGCGFKHCVDALQAVQIANGDLFEFKPVSVEAIYGFSRVEVGGGRIRGDGSVGAWAFQAVKEYGNLPMEGELGEFDPYRARQWGRSGVPDALEDAARQHIVKGGAKVTSWQDVQRAVRQGYPIPVCSDQGFRMQRDQDGFCRPRGTWMHCMAIVGVRGGDRPGAFILNSWGDSAHTGPRWPEDAPPGGFWADPETVDRMVRQGDSFALSDVAGFPARKLDWLVKVPAARPEFFARSLFRGDHDPLLLRAIPADRDAAGHAAGLAW